MTPATKLAHSRSRFRISIVLASDGRADWTAASAELTTSADDEDERSSASKAGHRDAVDTRRHTGEYMIDGPGSIRFDPLTVIMIVRVDRRRSAVVLPNPDRQCASSRFGVFAAAVHVRVLSSSVVGGVVTRYAYPEPERFQSCRYIRGQRRSSFKISNRSHATSQWRMHSLSKMREKKGESLIP